MQEQIFRAILPYVVSIKYGLFFWSAFIFLGTTGAGLTLLTDVLIYVYWFAAFLGLLLVTFQVIGFAPPESKEEKEVDKDMRHRVIREIPIISYIETRPILSRLINPITVLMAFYGLNYFGMHEQLSSLATAFVAMILLSVLARVLSSK